jgi:hypothetical protein
VHASKALSEVYPRPGGENRDTEQMVVVENLGNSRVGNPEIRRPSCPALIFSLAVPLRRGRTTEMAP